MEKSMGNNEIQGYEPFVDELKQLIHKKQYHVLKVINAETINLYWEIGEEIYRQQQEKGWGKSIVQILSQELQKEFSGAKGYSAANLWRMRNFYLTYRDSEKLAPLVREMEKYMEKQEIVGYEPFINELKELIQKLVGVIISSLWKNVRMI